MTEADRLIHDHDLRQWRACHRRWWWQQQPAAVALPQPLHPATPGGPVPGDAPDAEALQGPLLQEALRASHPGALVVPAPQQAGDWPQALALTAQALADPRLQQPGGAVLGACLRSDDGALVRVDVLRHAGRGWQLLKLRLATVGGSSDVDTVALWAHVAARCGLRVAGLSLLLMDTDFVYPGQGLYAGLFREVDLRPMLGDRPVAQWLVQMRQQARLPATGPLPPGNPGEACTQPTPCAQKPQCPQGQAVSQPGLPPADSLALVGRELAAALSAEGFRHLREVPPQRLQAPRHRRVWQAVAQGGPVLWPGADALLQALPWPRRFLRIDTIGFAIPVWAGTRPYQVMPVQFGCDVQHADGRLQRLRFLAGASADARPAGGGDPRRALAEALVQALGTGPQDGPVLAYNAGFERNRLRELAAQFEDLAPALASAIDRTVDLFQLAREHWYHPAQCGSWSFRAVAQALAPELGAHREACGGQPSAQAAFARSLQPRLPEAERAALRQALAQQMDAQCALLRRMAQVLSAPLAATA